MFFSLFQIWKKIERFSFQVLQMDPEATIDEIKKQYRKLSILVHPDKNPEDPEKAQQAFDSKNFKFFSFKFLTF